MQGVVKCIKPERLFGFVESADAGGDVFFHASELQHPLDFDEQLIGRRVEFDLGKNVRDGRSKAVCIRPAP